MKERKTVSAVQAVGADSVLSHAVRTAWKGFRRGWILLSPILIVLSAVFLPFGSLSFSKLPNGQSFDLTLFRLITTNLSYEGNRITMPATLRAAAVLCLAAAVAALVFLIFRKGKLCGLSLLVSAACTIFTVIFMTSIPNTAGSVSLGRLTVSTDDGMTAILLLGLLGGIFALWFWNYEKFFQYVLLFAASVAVVSVAVITLYMVVMGVPAIVKIGLFDFLFNTEWKPTASVPSFGIGSMILATLFGTLGAVLVGAPIGVLCAVFLAHIAPKPVAFVVRPAINLLAGIPSVVYGFFGMKIIVPAIRDFFHIPVGDSLLAVIIILCIMILPTIISITESSLRAVPYDYMEASRGLGATKIQSIFKIIIPAARSGIVAGLILGVGRAIGETMAVVMVAGNKVNFPELLVPVRPMTTGIVLEMAYSADLHRQALFAIGLVLFIFIMLVNMSFHYIMKKGGLRHD